jgi:hypothetical protein
MANNLARNPWTLDTAGATPLTTKQLRIRKLRWVVTAAGAAADDCVIQDASGRETFRFVNHDGTTQYQYEIDFSDGGAGGIAGFPILGFILDTITRGTLYVYLF